MTTSPAAPIDDYTINRVDGKQSKQRRSSKTVTVWTATLIVLSLLAMLLALRFYQTYGTWAIGVFGCIGFIAVLYVAIVFLTDHNPALENKDTNFNTTLYAAFHQQTDASLITRNGIVVMANKAYFRLAAKLGVTELHDKLPTLDRLFVGEALSEMTLHKLYYLDAGSDPAHDYIEAKDEDGQYHRFLIQVHAIGQDKFWRIIDVTETHETMDTCLSEAPIGLLCIDDTGKIISCNQALLKWLGRDISEAPRKLSEIISASDEFLSQTPIAGRTLRLEQHLFTKNGMRIPAVMLAEWREISGGAYIANIAIHGFMVHRDQNVPTTDNQSLADTEAGLNTISQAHPERRSEERDGADFTQAPIAILALDNMVLSEAVITRANAAFSGMTGLHSFDGLTFKSLFQTDVSEGSHNFLDLDARDCAPDVPYDAVLKTAAGDKLDVSVYVVTDSEMNSCRIYLVDISVRKSLESELVQSQKMEGIGRLVAEIAHDFNNILAAIRLNTDALLERHPIGDPAYPELQQINSNVNRATGLVSRLKSYSRKQTVRAVKLDVSESMSDISMTLKQVLGERVSMNMVHGRNLAPIKFDPVQLDQVMINLGVNARDAMKAQGGGEILITSSMLHRADIETASLKGALAGLKGDKFVVITVKDTGSGMSEDVKSKIFEPFFTTKAQGEGTGLGLATVYGIIKQAGGHLAVDSEIGVGTTFTIYIPAMEDDTQDAHAVNTSTDTKAKPAKKVKAPSDLAGHGHILFVEDEVAVRGIAAKTLRKRGYKVVEAGNGDEAYELIEAQETPFDLMISDVVMPGMDGPTLLRKARAKLGDARIVFISGYAEEEFSDLLAEEPDVTFLPKPFSLVDLAERVKMEIGNA